MAFFQEPSCGCLIRVSGDKEGEIEDVVFSINQNRESEIDIRLLLGPFSCLWLDNMMSFEDRNASCDQC